MSIKATIEGSRIVKVSVNGYEFPCDVVLEGWDEVKSLLERLISLGVFRRPKTPSTSDIEKLISSLGRNERRAIGILSIDQYTPMEKLRSELGMGGRQVAGVLANITRKARKLRLVGEGERIYESRWEKGQYHYRLREEFSILLKHVRGGGNG